MSGGVFVNLSNYTASNLAQGFSSIQNFYGSATNNSLNRLTGASSQGQWTVYGPNTGTYVNQGKSYYYTNFPNLAGGTGGDTFTMTVTGDVKQIMGGATPGSSGTTTLILPSNKSNTIIFGSDSKSGCFASGVAGGCINDPINFSGINTFKASGSDQIFFSSA